MAGSAFPVDDARLMTLAGVAYGALEKIPEYLANAELLGGEWSAAWLPAAKGNPDNLAYLAVNEAKTAAVIAIRGTYPNPLSPIYWENGQQDSPFGAMVAWNNHQSAKISGGTQTGFVNLFALGNDQGQTLADAVAALDPAIPIIVTGHSLGGTLAPVVALWLADNVSGRAIYSVSFAGMTPGNAAFAGLFGPGTALAGRTRRVFNTLDSVSFGWNQVLATRNFFEPSPRGGILVKLFLVIAWLRLHFGGYGYTAIGDAVPLAGAVSDPSQKHGLISYVIETLHQHMPDTYLALMNAPALPFSILFGTLTTDQKSPRNHAPRASALPVYHL